MGEVYRARDTRLDRMVAVKVLAAAFASDQPLRERFEREARSIAALNHPHICTLHDIGREGNATFLVMEILDGETLAERLIRGALPLEQALRHAIEIAGGLDKAHRVGIVHRDLKPGNIMLTKAGAKLLDFGLAKRETPAVAGSGLSVLPTTPPNLTTQGTILGTFQYMAPEQLEGREADARTDIFAFGTVLYEMVTGRKAFEGKSQVGLIGAILERDPAPVSTILPTCPAALDRVVQRCLAKDPDDRWQSAGDLAAQLNWIDHKASNIPATAKASGLWIAVASVMALLAAGLGVAALYFYRARGVEPVLQFSVLPPDGNIFDTAQPGFRPIMSPDGTRLAFTARDASGTIQIWVRSLDTLTPRLLHGTEGASYPFWSPDGRSIAFFAQETLKRVDIAGGPVLTLSEAVGRGGSWHRNGVILFSRTTNSPIFRIASGGGEPVAVTTLTTGQRGHRFPSFLPDGRRFIYAALGATNEEIFVGSLDSNEAIRLLTADSNALYSPPGELLFVRDGTLLRQSFNATTLELSGEASPVAGQVALSGGLAAFSVSETGVLAYRSGPGTSGNVQLAWVDRSGKVVETVGAPGPYRGIDVSRDGKHIAVHRHDGSGGDVWLMDSARGTMSRFTFDAAQDNAMPIWSPDGSRIAFGSLRNGKWGVYEKAANRTGGEQLLVESDLQKMPMSWSPDGRFLLYWVIGAKTGGDQWMLPLTGDKKPIPLLQTSFNEAHAQISPNGKWVAYTSNETRRQEIYVRPFPSGDGIWPISVNGGTFARWRPDGTELFYMSATSLGKLMSVKVNPDSPTLEYGSPTELFDSGYVNFTHGLNYHTYAVSPDGQRFLIPRPEGEERAVSAPLTVVVNWTAAFTR
jgi:Tol biopolymer transport system component